MEGNETKQPLLNVADNVTGNTPLMYAAMENKINHMDKMLELGCDINAKNKVEKWKYFVFAYDQGKLSEIFVCRSVTQHFICPQCTQGRTPLNSCCRGRLTRLFQAG